MSKLTDTIKEQIRNKFVQGIDDNGTRVLFTIDQLAEEFDVAKSTLYRHSQEESWKRKQAEFQEQYRLELDEQRRKTLLEKSKKFDENTLNISQALLGQIGKTIHQAGKERPMAPNIIRALASATLEVQKISKLALGESTENMSLNAKVQNTEAFRETMELLDEIAEQRRDSDEPTIQ